MCKSEMKKPSKIFISHSSEDLAFVKPLVELFQYIGLNPENMFCSSVSGYDIPLGNNILDYLKEQFQTYDLIVIFVLSENYYKSPICLNEMGAAWVLQHTYRSVLLPQFDFKDIKGVINNMDISIKLDTEKYELKSRLSELRDMIMSEFGFKESVSKQNIWERHRDEFIDKVTSIEIYWEQLHQFRKQNRPLGEWVLPLQKLIEINPASYDAMYMLGTIYAEMNDIDNAIKYLKMTVNLSKNKELEDKASKRLFNLGYII